MAEFPMLPLWTDAYIADTHYLTCQQHGAYFLLLMAAWRSGDCALPNDDVLLARYCHLDLKTWMKEKSVILRYWKLGEDGFLRQSRLSDEFDRSKTQRKKAAMAGKVSALKRLARHSTPVDPMFQQNGNPLNHTLKKKEEKKRTPPNPQTIEPKSEVAAAPLRGSDLLGEVAPSKVVAAPPVLVNGSMQAFDDFWKIYPNKRGGRADAMIAFAAALKITTAEKICAAVRLYPFDPKDGFRFNPHAHRWLKQQRWEVAEEARQQAALSHDPWRQAAGYDQSDQPLAAELPP